MSGSQAQVFYFKKKFIIGVVLSGVAAALAWHLLSAAPQTASSPEAKSQVSGNQNRRDLPNAKRAGANNLPTAVTAVQAKTNSINTVQSSIGTVVPAAEVVVHSRVSGQLTQVFFEEGQWVKQGQLLAQIDPRPFAADLAQMQGQADRNKAVLRNAEQDLERYLSLRTQSAISQQQIDSQKMLVEQYRGTVLADQGALERAKLQLSFTQIIAPIEGRIGLRNLDAGNNIAPTDAQGLAVITQVQPVNIIFTLPEDSLPALLEPHPEEKSAKRGLGLFVEAWDKSNRQVLAQGEVISLDNRIDPATGTIKLKASFDNKDSRLFPNQFVNLRLQLGNPTQATIVPITAIQRGSQGTYVYVVQAAATENSSTGNNSAANIGERTAKNNQSVAIRLVKLGASEANQVAVLEGLSEGEWVVTQGVDKLREGAKVIASTENGAEINTSDKPLKDPVSEPRKGHKNSGQKT